ncbi:MAG: hypothetical protein HY395_01150 [Candidatus Doudnabacteria bacterium]|nr:hypothetical protein [Candidatus Doudnabacteria bacterium]
MNEQDKALPSNILDTIIGSQTQNNLSSFEPVSLISRLLSQLKERERLIVSSRFGLDGGELQTLEAIGKLYHLTRERVRQIEKDSMSQLLKKKSAELASALQLIFDTITEYGNVISEEFLIQILLPAKADLRETRGVKFFLHLGEQFKYHRETQDYNDSWNVVGFNPKKLDEVMAGFVDLLKKQGRVLTQDEFYQVLKKTAYYEQHKFELTDKVIKSYLDLSKVIQINPFNEIGLKDWSEVRPRDVGDKAYLVLKHHGKPEHYSIITKMINDHKFDSRTAYQETVHNELIKDERFVLIGRGIYALVEWGYKKGIVADVIKEVLSQAGRPLSREEIISEVLKRRMVKRNTVLVGLSNKQLFQKVGKDKYALSAQPVS